MYRKTLSIFLTLLFLGLITAPSIIIALDDSVDISYFYSLSEEEEENKNFNLLAFEECSEANVFEFSTTNKQLGYFFKNYPKPHLNLIFPPPELLL